MPNPALRATLAGCILLIGLFLLVSRGPIQTSLTGVVSDTSCAAHLSMAGNAACVRNCVKAGAAYALVVGSNLFPLAPADPQVLAALNRLAGARAAVRGTLAGMTLTVRSAVPAR